jgi:hypothetical protein
MLTSKEKLSEKATTKLGWQRRSQSSGLLRSPPLARLSHRSSRRALRLRRQTTSLKRRFKPFANVTRITPIIWTASMECFRTLCAAPEAPPKRPGSRGNKFRLRR